MRTTEAEIPDLLHPEPMRRVAFEPTDLAIVLAFAGGTSGGLFEDALRAATIAPSTWEPRLFADDLFLKQFVTTCFQTAADDGDPPVATKHTVRLLANPPSDPRAVQFRRGIVAELMGSANHRRELSQLYRVLRRFRALLEGGSSVGGWDANRRQLDILALFKTAIERMVDGFQSATSGLSRVHAFGARVAASEGFESLCALLRYDESMATLKLEVGIGADGRIRELEVQSLREHDENPFHNPPWRRWLAKTELFLRGFRFSDGEVMARLLDAVFEGVRSEVVSLVQLFGDLEFYLGACAFLERARRAGLEVCLPELGTPDQPRQLLGLFNPLLLGHGVQPVPCDITTDRHDTALLVTGPNSGGKTRLLQSLGLAQVLAQSGLFIPARAGRLSLTPSLVVSLIQETTADQAEGRLGTELVRIRSLFEHLPPGAMVVLDELCSGTNPSEGEEIFELVVTMLTKLRPQAFITTHFLGFAARLERERKIPDLRFLQVVLDESQRPTYQFEPGVAQTSLAGHAAQRLGVTGEQLLALIEKKVNRGTRAG